MNNGSFLGGLIAGAAIWAAMLLAIWSMDDPVRPGERLGTLAPIAAEALRDNQIYIERGLLNILKKSLDDMAIPGMAVPHGLEPGTATPREPLRPASAASLAGGSLPGAGT